MSLSHLRAKMSGVHIAHREYGRSSASSEGSCGGCGRSSGGAYARGGAGVAPSPRGTMMRTSSSSTRFAGGGRYRYAMPPSSGHEKSRRHPAAGSREVLRRALMPASRRPTLRCWNFRPTPSRLCNMSMAPLLID